MASDLIPPPSPAGRPVPDGMPRPEGAPRFIELPPEPVPLRASAPEAKHAAAALPPSRFRNRFGFLMGAMGGVVLAIVAVLAISLTGPSDNPGPSEGLASKWSPWQPSSSDESTGADQIAKHVGALYRLGSGAQLDQVSGTNVPTGSTGIHLAIRPQQGNIQILGGKTIMYTLNGLGPDGSIQSGTPTEARHQLVRREALELALYSFRYLKGVETVVALLPPALPVNAKATTTKQSEGPTTLDTITQQSITLEALVYRPGDLKQYLQVPLNATLSPRTPRPATMGGAEGRRVDALTLSNIFEASFEQAQDYTPYLVLDRANFK